MQTPSWQDISSNYYTETEAGPPQSRAVVCDINKEMLKVGKQKADSMGIRAGTFLNNPGSSAQQVCFPLFPSSKRFHVHTAGVKAQFRFFC